MDDSELNTAHPADASIHNQPAVGIQISPQTSSDAVAGAILRTQRQGHHVFVAHERPTNGQALEFAQELGATIVESKPNRTNGNALPTGLLHAARAAGFPGVIWQDDPTVRIDFQRSVQQLHETSDYHLEARHASVATPDSDEASSTPSPMDQQSVMAIIPAYNEGNTITDVIADTRPYVDEIVVINDASTDDTAAVAAEHADGVVTHPQNLGVGGAVHTGYRVAIREGYDVVIQIDGDGQHDPSYIPELLAELDENDADMVIGSRWLNGSYQDYSPVRRAGIRFFTFEANVIGGLSITDVTSGFRAYDVKMLADLRRPNNSHWALEQTLEAARKGYTITEVSVPMPPQCDGSQFNLRTLVAYPLRMMLITLKVLLYR